MSTINNVDFAEKFTCISLCTGYGGIEIGLKRVIPTLRTIVYVERECYAVANLVAKIEEGKMDSAPIWTDVKTFNGQPFHGKVDIIVGGYPCQPFSVAGKRQGTDDQRHLWPDIARIVQAVRPVWCFFENVPGHLTIGFPEVYRSLRNMGYSVEAGLFTASECGIGIEKGQRLFILAQAESYNGSLLLQPRKQRQTNINFRRSSAILGKTNNKRLQRRGQSMQRRRAKFASSSLIVAPQGTAQYAWEAKRYVEPGLDGTTHGSPYRVDRLRLLGNGVVPQQAELAFSELIKFF